jgi:hypothetical protein
MCCYVLTVCLDVGEHFLWIWMCLTPGSIVFAVMFLQLHMFLYIRIIYFLKISQQTNVNHAIYYWLTQCALYYHIVHAPVPHAPYCTIRYDHRIWWSYMMIIYDDPIWWSYVMIMYMMIMYDDHIRWSYMIIIYDGHIWWSCIWWACMMIIYDDHI